METLNALLGGISGFVWGPWLLLPLLLGVGIYLTFGLRCMPWLKIGTAFKTLWSGRSGQGDGDVSPFQALMTAMSATIGTGNIAGVATAIALGGPGAIFWMWITALFGMATKYAEAVLAVHYRETDDLGNKVGGPMYYIRSGMGDNWAWLGFLFALFGMLAAPGIGNAIQSNSVAQTLHTQFGTDTAVTGLVMAAFAAAVIFGGIKRIGQVAEKLVPIMAIAYITGSLTIIILHIDAVPAALRTIVDSAFTGSAATGGFAGASVWMAIRFGVARGIFSNEAGLGSAPIAHAAAQTDNPVRQGTVAMLGTFIDTLLICTMTALVIIVTGAWTSGETSGALSAMAFASGLPGGGSLIVTLGLVVFAFTTILGWSYYGERCAEYLFGVRAIWPYRVIWIAIIPLGALAAGSNIHVTSLWLIADILNGLMALPNLIALIVLSPVIFRLTREHFSRP